MNTEISDEALEYGTLAQRAFESAGGDELVQKAESEPHRREDVVAPVLSELGAWELDPWTSTDDLEAAASLCRAAGFWALPYPVAERLSRPADLGVDGLMVVGSSSNPLGPIAGLKGRWAAVSLDGRRSLATGRVDHQSPRMTAFVTGLDLVPIDSNGRAEVALGLVLPCWTLLGMLDRALTLTRAYVLDRQQFGQPLAAFQSVQFQITDAEVERVGVEELAKYSLWSVEAGREEALEDALALRLAAVEAADTVFRIAHQLHGAIGFCDETALSWLSRYSMPLRRLPFGVSGTRDELTRRLGRRGLSGLFSGASG
jgi:hypothetical protein